jgi:hypothetical protein
LRTTLIGQHPSPSASAAVMKACSASPASTAAFMNMSSVSLGKGRARSRLTRRMRRWSPQNTMKSGACAIHGMSGIHPPMVVCFARSFTSTIPTCWRSDFDGAESAAARAISSTSSGIGSGL